MLWYSGQADNVLCESWRPVMCPAVHKRKTSCEEEQHWQTQALSKKCKPTTLFLFIFNEVYQGPYMVSIYLWSHIPGRGSQWHHWCILFPPQPRRVRLGARTGTTLCPSRPFRSCAPGHEWKPSPAPVLPVRSAVRTLCWMEKLETCPVVPVWLAGISPLEQR